MYVVQLTDDYTNVREAIEGQTWNRILINEHREAPAVFRHGESYFMIHSGCTGWLPNPVLWSRASNPLGPWKTFGSIFPDPHSLDGFRTQPAFVIQPPDFPTNSFLYVGDRWNEPDLSKSDYIWMSLIVDRDQNLIIDERIPLRLPKMQR